MEVADLGLVGAGVHQDLDAGDGVALLAKRVRDVPGCGKATTICRTAKNSGAMLADHLKGHVHDELAVGFGEAAK